MRTWVGQEMEGDVKDTTLFVESDYVFGEQASRVINYAHEHGIERIYFGAGRMDTCFDDDAKELLNECELDLVVETTPDGYYRCQGISAKYVVRIELNGIGWNKDLVLKIDNMTSWCAVSNELIATSIDDVKDGMYKGDTEVQV